MAADIVRIETTNHERNMQALQKDVREWAKQTRTLMGFELAKLNLREKDELFSRVRFEYRKRKSEFVAVKEPPLRKSLKSGIKKKYGEIESAWISFARHGIFLELGVGRNRPKGSSYANRAARPWMTHILEARFKLLEKLVEERYADIVALEIRLLIPGIIDSRISQNMTIDTDVASIVIDKSFF